MPRASLSELVLFTLPAVPSVPHLCAIKNSERRDADMQIEVNGEQREIPAGLTVAQLLEELDLDPRFLAVELNLQLVPRGNHADTLLAEGDRLEVVTLVGGG